MESGMKNKDPARRRLGCRFLLVGVCHMNLGCCVATFGENESRSVGDAESAGAVLGSGAGARACMRSFHPPSPNQAALNQVFKILILIQELLSVHKWRK